jgi:hypothetical protein
VIHEYLRRLHQESFRFFSADRGTVKSGPCWRVDQTALHKFGHCAQYLRWQVLLAPEFSRCITELQLRNSVADQVMLVQNLFKDSEFLSDFREVNVLISHHGFDL